MLMILGGTSWYQITNFNEMSDETQVNYELSFLASQIHREMKNQAISLRDIVIFEDQEVIDQELALLEEQSNFLRENITLLETTVSLAEHKALVTELKDIYQTFDDYKKQVMDTVIEGEKGEAIKLIGANSRSIHDDFSQVMLIMSNTFSENLDLSLQSFLDNFKRQFQISSFISVIGILVVLIVIFHNIWTFTRRLNKVSNVMNSVANGNADLDTEVEILSNDEIDEVARSFNKMTHSLALQTKKEQELTWIKSNTAEITTILTGIHDLENLSKTFLSKIVPLVEASQAVFYVKERGKEDGEEHYRLLASYAFKERKHLSNTIVPGEGIVGQAVLEKTPIILTDVPSDYIRVKSGLGEAPPLTIYVIPIQFEGKIIAVLELASFKSFNLQQQRFLEEMTNGIGIILESVMSRIQLARLLEESQMLTEEVQAQSEELQSQQEELRMTNEELEEQTRSLRQSEEKLQVQQEELEQANAELKEKAARLEERNKIIEMTNQEMALAQAELEEKAMQLALSSKYKSEFLANMSHELRTPLNSLLLLSKLLADNASGNLTEKQVKYSETIYSSGNDLLILINDILDLAKIESGKMDIIPSKVQIGDLIELVESTFRPIANENKLQFNIHREANVPDFLFSDQQKIYQVLKNLLSNAFKFTLKGEVTFKINHIEKNYKSQFIFSIIDTGVGIPKEKQELIFQAFQQADGSTSRKFGGSGLGLSICREIASRLGGEIKVDSEEEKGSIFTFYVSDYEGEELNYDKVVDEVAVTIDHQEPLSPSNDERLVQKESGTETTKGKSEIKRVLIVDDDPIQRNSLMEFIGNKNAIIKAVSTGYEAIEELKVGEYDCIVLDLGLEDTSGFELLEKIKKNVEFENVKVLIYTGKDLSSKEEIYLNKYTDTIIIKDVHSPQRLKDELTLYLNSNHESSEGVQPDEEQILMDPSLQGKKILLVDDDVRNVYALSSILELYGMNITFAENGLECLELLEAKKDFDLILMDIMMPEMDGYEAIKRIRENPKTVHLPVIALTAKAMKEDRDKCIEAGASDYIVKPIDTDQLISLIKVWLYTKGIN